MHHRSIPSLGSMLALVAGLTVIGAEAQAARFVYEGRLEDLGRPAHGRYDLRLSAFGHEKLGTSLGAPITVESVDVRDGRFRLEVDLPWVESDQVWLEVAVREAGAPAFSAIPGRSKAIAAPLIGSCWSTTGDSGSNPATNFLGTTDDQPLVLRTANAQSLRIEPSAATFGGLPITRNLIAGSHANAVSVGVRGATIAGGGVPGGGDSDPDFTLEAPNRVTDHYGTIGGGFGNRAGDNAGGVGDRPFATVAGGQGNTASGTDSTVGGGRFNVASGGLSTVDGGLSNVASGAVGTVGGGQSNTASGELSTVVGGLSNTASGDYGTVGGGSGNCAGGFHSWAGGRRAVIRPGTGSGATGDGCLGMPLSGDADGDEGSFVWADNEPSFFVSSGANQFNVRAQGGVGINMPPRNPNVELTVRGRSGDAFGGNADAEWIVNNGNLEGVLISTSAGGPGSNDAEFTIAHVNPTEYAPRMTLHGSGAVTIRSNTTGANTGVTMAANAGSWSSLSDRRLKTAIEPVDAAAVLARLLSLPLSTWSYIAQGEGIRHMGPMAQDFRAAFGLGEDDTTISTVDADGVALAAIQGLNQKLEAERDALKAENAELRARLERLETLLAERIDEER